MSVRNHALLHVGTQTSPVPEKQLRGSDVCCDGCYMEIQKKSFDALVSVLFFLFFVLFVCLFACLFVLWVLKKFFMVGFFSVCITIVRSQIGNSQ